MTQFAIKKWSGILARQMKITLAYTSLHVHTYARTHRTLIGWFVKYVCLSESYCFAWVSDCMCAVQICNPYVAMTGSPVSIHSPFANEVNPEGNPSALFPPPFFSSTPFPLVLFLTIIPQRRIGSREEESFCHKCSAMWSGHVLFTWWLGETFHARMALSQ